ncbi:unnamed protein product [Schistosoma curassoni]|uniref:Uncharacterized protein n=1 Tax=Schistosoma curassoni TaxID=6186 RepID=A0A183KV55_9TREM|nr:unnamed protein product [Schistosoma curassoni]
MDVQHHHVDHVMNNYHIIDVKYLYILLLNLYNE